MHTLISFLGGTLAPKPNEKRNTDKYNKTIYKFNNKELPITKFLSIVLTQEIKPEKLLLIGTPTSIWDVFFLEQDIYSDAVDKLMQHMDQYLPVTEEILDPCIPDIETILGCQVECIIIDFAKNEKEQVALLKHIADALNQGDTISLDVTHSFRHLPMLSLVASRFLKNIKNIETKDIYYGAWEMRDTNNIAPIINLNGMLKMLDWVDALSVYNHSGNYGVFSPLFAQEGEQKQAEYLKEATFFENINRTDKAKSNLDAFLAVPQSEKTLNNPMIQLFDEELKSRIKNVNDSDQFTRQFKLAKFYLDKKDYLRASILAQEAWISKMEKSYDIQEQKTHKRRNEAKAKFEKECKQHDEHDILSTFKDLSDIRNSCAHASDSQTSRAMQYLKNEKNLKDKLNNSLEIIKNWEPTE